MPIDSGIRPGKRFGHLVVREDTGLSDQFRSKIWICDCDCGGEKRATSQTLNRRKTTSCGCRMAAIISGAQWTTGEDAELLLMMAQNEDRPMRLWAHMHSTRSQSAAIERMKALRRIESEKSSTVQKWTTMPCMTCRKDFLSWDRRKNRLCDPCRKGISSGGPQEDARVAIQGWS